MATFALIKNGIVKNIIVADQAFIDTYMKANYDYCIEYTTSDAVGVGFGYDAENQKFIDPNIPV